MGDVSGTKDFTPEHEELVKKLGAKAAVQCIVDAAALFKKSAKNFKKDDLPIQMTVADWRGEAGIGDDDEEDEEEDGEDDEEDEEEAGEEDEEDENVEPTNVV